jgi:5-methylcytosine-specific restriction endonuclease McrA
MFRDVGASGVSPLAFLCSRCRRRTDTGLPGMCSKCQRADNRRRHARQAAHGRDTREWRKQIRPAVLERDGHRCVDCGSTENLQADFIPSGVHTRNLDDYATRCAACHTRKTVAQSQGRKRGAAA